jgi:tetratricopeptide (TPR) repeat protein
LVVNLETTNLPDDIKQTSVLNARSKELLKLFLENIGKFVSKLSDVLQNDYMFECDYPSNIKQLGQIREELENIKQENPEIYDWAKLGFNGIKCYFEGNKDIAMGQYETPNLEKGRSFLLAFAERVPEELATVFQQKGVDFKTEGRKNALGIKAMSAFSAANAHMRRGEYEEAARDFEESFSLTRETELEIVADLEPLEWYAKGLNLQYEQGKFSEAADAFRKSAELYQQMADEATLEENIFEEGRAISMKAVCDQRASICRALHNKIGNSLNYQSVRQDINTVKAEYNEEVTSISSVSEILALRQISKEIEGIMVNLQNLKKTSELFSLESEVFERLYEEGDSINTEISTCVEGLNEIRKTMGTTLQSPTATMDRDRYRRTLRKMVNQFNESLLPAYQNLVEELVKNRTQIEDAAGKKRAVGEKVPNEPEVKQLLDNANTEVTKAKDMKTKLKSCYDSATKFLEDAAPYITPLGNAIAFVLRCIGK